MDMVKKMSLFLLLLLIPFLGLFTLNIYAQEDDTTLEWDSIGTYYTNDSELANVSTDLPILFVGDDCEYCDSLKTDLKGVLLLENKPQVANVSLFDSFTYTSALVSKCSFINEIKVPTLIYGDECITGATDVKNRLNLLSVEEQSATQDERLDLFTNYLSIQEFIEKGLFENVRVSFKVWEYA